MSILQRWLGWTPANRACRVLLDNLRSRPRLDLMLRDLAAAEAVWQEGSTSFGLAYALGQACELVASYQGWEDRAPWLERALALYDQALALARDGVVTDAELVPDVAADRWDRGLSLSKRALLAASLQVGVLRAAEFRLRDPARAIEDLRRVALSLRGYHPVWYYLGEACLLDGDFSAAEAAWREGLARAPGDPALTAVLANLPADRVHQSMKLGDWPGVIRELDRTPPNAMSESERWTIAGDAYLALDDPEAARRCWQSALAVDRHAVGVQHRLRRLTADLSAPADGPYAERADPRGVL